MIHPLLHRSVDHSPPHALLEWVPRCTRSRRTGGGSDGVLALVRRALAVCFAVGLCLIAFDLSKGGLSTGALLAGVATWIGISIAGEVLLYVARHTLIR